MCGIHFLIKRNNSTAHSTTNTHCLKNRGPDDTAFYIRNNIIASFYRLAINDVNQGMQPFIRNNIVLLCNGEIYNYKELIKKHDLSVLSNSDCECILAMYIKFGIDITIHNLQGEFAFILYDGNNDVVYFARDIFGRKPLFYGIDKTSDISLTSPKNYNANIMNENISEHTQYNYDTNNTNKIEIASLYSALSDHISNKQQVIPGYIYMYESKYSSLSIIKYFTFTYRSNNVSLGTYHKYLMSSFTEAVKKRVTQSERPVGFLLSGGFDSSLVLSVAIKEKFLAQPPHVFTIGFNNEAPDIKSAEIMVDYLKQKYGNDCLIWHKVILPIEHGINAIPHVIKALETYDTTTIRASTPMYLISEYISKNTDVKVVLSGEGSDELFGGYLYFRYATNKESMQKEIIKLLEELYLYDVLRADRTTAHFGLEVRAPFLDEDFVTTALNSNYLFNEPGTTKSLIRNAVSYDLLPECIRSGKKEAFSDAVGLQWKDALQYYANKLMESNQLLLNNDYSYKWLSPNIKDPSNESIWYQHIFYNWFPNSWHLLPKLWLPNQDWIKTGNEPSARVLDVYNVNTVIE